MYHIVLLAQNREGLVNLYKLISLSHMKYYHRRPRIPRESSRSTGKGISVGSACEAGELYQAILNNAGARRSRRSQAFTTTSRSNPSPTTISSSKKGGSVRRRLKEINRRIVGSEKLGKPRRRYRRRSLPQTRRRGVPADHHGGPRLRRGKADPTLPQDDRRRCSRSSPYLGEELAYEVVVKRPGARGEC